MEDDLKLHDALTLRSPKWLATQIQYNIRTRTNNYSYTVVIAFILTAALSTLAWIFAPKQNQTVWRSSVILGLSMCYLMWAITYLSQLHPLEAPRRSDLRPEK